VSGGLRGDGSVRSGEQRGAFPCDLLAAHLIVGLWTSGEGGWSHHAPLFLQWQPGYHRLGICCSSPLNTPPSARVSVVPSDFAIPHGAAGEIGHLRAEHQDRCSQKDHGAGIVWERAGRLNMSSEGVN